MRFHDLFNFIVYFFILTFVKNSYSARKSNSNRNNQIIYAKLGDTINISCWFDPKLLQNQQTNFYSYDNNNVNNFFSNNNNNKKRKRRRSPPHRSRHINSYLKTSSSSPSVVVINGNYIKSNSPTVQNGNEHEKIKNPHHHYFFKRKSIDYFNSNENTQDNYFKQSSAKNNDVNDAEIESSNNLINENSADNMIKYELDWYFLDRQGRMNIISYGNQTSKDTKYKTFILLSSNSNTDSSIRTRLIDNNLNRNNELAYSSSALYSQSSKSFNDNSNNYEYSTGSNTNKYYTYYLNALIESEDDEGVYQCINPDLPNFILRNVTVLIERNKSVSLITTSFLQKSIIFSIQFIFLIKWKL